MKRIITLSIALLAGTVSFAQCSELFFSEYIEGSSNNKAIEIYNPTSGPIDLADYVVKRHNNGATTPSGTFGFPVGTILAASDVYVIGNPSADPAILAVADTTNAATFYNGDDALILENLVTGDTVDVIGELGVDPGAAWTVGTGSTQNFTLVRMIGIQQGTNSWTVGATEWDVFPQDVFDSLGMHTMTSCAPPVPMFGPCGELFFSEYIEGSSSNKALEIYNPTGFDIDLSNYVIYRANNGSPTPTDSIFPVGTILAGDVFVIGNPSAIAGIQAETDTTHTLTFYNGDDALYMINMTSGDTLDIIGQIGVDPGSGWTVGSGATNNFTLVRQISINQGELNWTVGATQWDVFPIDMIDSLGAHTMTACGTPCSPTTFNQTIVSCTPVTSPSGTYTWTTTGIYNDTIFDAGGCDSLYVVDLTIGAQTTSTISATGCSAYSSPSGQVYTASGMYMDTIPNALGCDSVITINLVIDPAGAGCANQCSELFFSEYIEGSSNNKALEIYNPTGGAIDLVDYVVKRHTNGSPTASGTYDFPAGTFIAAGDVYVIANSSADSLGIIVVSDTTNAATFFNGDDALILENVATGDTIDVIGEVGVDPGTNWPVGSGATSEFTLVRNPAIQQGNNVWASAAAEWTVFPQNTFDSLGSHTMVACTVLPCTDTGSSFAVSDCDSYTSPSGMTWTASGTYNDTIQNAAGCDSVMVITLTINTSTSNIITEFACNSYTAPSGAVFTASGTYTDVIPNTAGCDSTITINLTITSVDVSTTLSGETLTAGATGATYQWIDCDNGNAAIVGETAQSFTATITGNYAVVVTENSCTDTSACTFVQVVGLPEFGLNNEVIVHPNPTSGEVTIDFGSTLNNVSVRVLDAIGREIDRTSITSADFVEMTINGEAGQYFVEVTVDGVRAAVKRVVKK
ncbi:MAG: lamin tail domain-containing protein [Crocinitomicaceae bacterium]|nr:lamin tail domain-containing protein [Crocinitomicaceae bacterium]